MPTANSAFAADPCAAILPESPSPSVHAGTNGLEASLPGVLFAATSDGDGGIERYSARMAAQLRMAGVNVAYACRAGGFLEKFCASLNVPTFPWNVRNSGDLRSAFDLARIARAGGFGIVHVHSRRDYVPALIGAKIAGKMKVVLHAHLVRPLGEPSRLAGWFFRLGADRVLSVSRTVQERLMEEHGFAPSFIPILPNGVDISAFSNADGSGMRRAWGVPQDALLLGMVGRLNAKGQDLLLRVAPDLLTRFPSLRIALVGPRGSDDAPERLRQLACSLGVAERVLMPGMVEDVPSAMAAFDALVHLPSDESFGLAPAEAMAAGKPVAATDIGGCRELIIDGVTGFLIPLDDRATLLDRLIQLLDPVTGETLRNRMGAAGRERITREFSLDSQTQRLLELYSSL